MHIEIIGGVERGEQRAKHRFSFIWQDRPEAEAELVDAHLRTEPETIAGFLREVRQRFGSVSNALGLSQSALGALRARYLEPTPGAALAR
jgi:hypothetical protein